MTLSTEHNKAQLLCWVSHFFFFCMSSCWMSLCWASLCWMLWRLLNSTIWLTKRTSLINVDASLWRKTHKSNSTWKLTQYLKMTFVSITANNTSQHLESMFQPKYASLSFCLSFCLFICLSVILPPLWMNQSHQRIIDITFFW